jgi:hypothetical protein
MKTATGTDHHRLPIGLVGRGQKNMDLGLGHMSQANQAASRDQAFIRFGQIAFGAINHRRRAGHGACPYGHDQRIGAGHHSDKEEKMKDKQRPEGSFHTAF